MPAARPADRLASRWLISLLAAAAAAPAEPAAKEWNQSEQEVCNNYTTMIVM